MLTPELLNRAVEILRQGGVVALPTETVYGLAANAEDELAVRRVFAIKGRPATHPLIVHLAGVEALPEWARDIPEEARRLAARLLARPPHPGAAAHAPAPRTPSPEARTPSPCVCPRHPVALAVLRALGGGLAAPSANRFGRVSPTTAEHVRQDLGDEVDLLLDGGPCTVGVESTIVDLSSGPPAILRPGGLPAEELERVLGRPVPVRTASTVRVSGSLASHYAPRVGVVLVEPSEAVARAESLRLQGLQVGVLGPAGLSLPRDFLRFDIPEDAAGAARLLYLRLREADMAGLDVLVACLPPAQGLGMAVRDRLARAAAPRPPEA